MDEADFGIVTEVVNVLNEKRRDAWIDIHNFRAQKYGNDLHIDCHLTLPNYFDLIKVHEEVKLVDQLINSEVTKDRVIYTYRPVHTTMLSLLQHAELPDKVGA